MYIEPNSVITLVKGVPFNNTYEHTIKFDNLQQQLEYFTNKETLKLQDTQYGRGADGLFRIAVPIGLARKYNYMMFKNNYNSLSDDKTYFAFITSVEYENNETSIITFEIDVMQTWMFDYEHRECIVDREHTVSDDLYEHLEPESVVPTSYVCNDVHQQFIPVGIRLLFDIEEYYYEDNTRILNIPTGSTNTQYITIYNVLKGDIITGAPTPCFIKYYYRDNPSLLQADIDNMIKNAKTKPTIIDASLVLSPIAYDGEGEAVTLLYRAKNPLAYNISAFTQNINSYGNHTIKNNKLKSYPYRKICVYNGENQIEFQPELFIKDNEFNFLEVINYGGITNSCIIPKYIGNYNYDLNGREIGQNNLFPSKSLSYTLNEPIPTIIDTYSLWVSSEGNRRQLENIFNLVGTSISVVGGIVSQNYVGAGLSLIRGVSSSMSLGELNRSYYNRPDTVQGSLPSNLNASSNRAGFIIYDYIPIDENVREIDDFFTRYGYACNKLKVPNIIVDRLDYCFTKTKNATLVGDVPNDDLQKITEIFNNGITHWKPTATVGDYN